VKRTFPDCGYCGEARVRLQKRGITKEEKKRKKVNLTATRKSGAEKGTDELSQRRGNLKRGEETLNNNNYYEEELIASNLRCSLGMERKEKRAVRLKKEEKRGKKSHASNACIFEGVSF